MHKKGLSYPASKMDLRIPTKESKEKKIIMRKISSRVWGTLFATRASKSSKTSKNSRKWRAYVD